MSDPTKSEFTYWPRYHFLSMCICPSVIERQRDIASIEIAQLTTKPRVPGKRPSSHLYSMGLNENWFHLMQPAWRLYVKIWTNYSGQSKAGLSQGAPAKNCFRFKISTITERSKGMASRRYLPTIPTNTGRQTTVMDVKYASNALTGKVGSPNVAWNNS